MPMSMVKSGHIIHAQAIFDEDFFLAWGDLGTGYADPWTSDDTPPSNFSTLGTADITKGAAGGVDNIGVTGVIKIVSIVDANDVIYHVGEDFYLDQNKVNWSAGDSEPATGVHYDIIYRVQNEDINSLIHELGRRRYTEKSYVIEDVAGLILFSNKRWTRVNYATRHVFLSFEFDSTEEPDATIYQIAVFVNSVPDTGLPEGQMYFTPSEITDPGSAYLIQNIDPFPRSAGSRQRFDYVITY